MVVRSLSTRQTLVAQRIVYQCVPYYCISSAPPAEHRSRLYRSSIAVSSIARATTRDTPAHRDAANGCYAYTGGNNMGARLPIFGHV